MDLINKKDIELTYFPDGYGVKATENKEVVIIDFFTSNYNEEKAIIASIALPKSGALDLIKQIKSIIGTEE